MYKSKASQLVGELFDNRSENAKTDSRIARYFRKGVYALALTAATLGYNGYAKAQQNYSEAMNSRQVYVVNQANNHASLEAALAINAGGIVNAATFRQGIAPCSIISIFGTSMVDGTYAAQNVPLPTRLGNTMVTQNGTPIPLFYASPTQINAQALCGNGSGTYTFNVINNGAQSNGVDVGIPIYSPGIFTLNQGGTGAGAVLNASRNYELVTPERPIRPGEIAAVFGTGLGDVSPPIQSGEPASSNPLRTVMSPTFADINGPARVMFSGLAPGFAGLYQANLVVPGTYNPATHTAVCNYPLRIGNGDTFTAGATIPVACAPVVNTPPSITSYTANPSSGTVPLATAFSWNFADSDPDTHTCRIDVDSNGTFEYTINPCQRTGSRQHTYTAPGAYTSRLTVDDGRGGTASRTVSVNVGAVPMISGLVQNINKQPVGGARGTLSNTSGQTILLATDSSGSYAGNYIGQSTMRFEATGKYTNTTQVTSAGVQPVRTLLDILNWNGYDLLTEYKHDACGDNPQCVLVTWPSFPVDVYLNRSDPLAGTYPDTILQALSEINRDVGFQIWRETNNPATARINTTYVRSTTDQEMHIIGLTYGKDSNNNDTILNVTFRVNTISPNQCSKNVAKHEYGWHGLGMDTESTRTSDIGNPLNLCTASTTPINIGEFQWRGKNTNGYKIYENTKPQ